MAKMKEKLGDLGTDAAKWTEALAKRIGELGNDALDFSPGGDLFGWVANMIEAGRSAGYAKGQEDLSTAAEFYSNFDSDIRDDEKLTILFVGGKAVGKSILARRLSEFFAEFEIDASHTVVRWKGEGDYDTLTVSLDAEDKKMLAKAMLIDVNSVPAIRAPDDGYRFLSADPVDMARAFVGDGIVRLDRTSLAAWFAIAVEAGADRKRKAGLNENSEVPVLSLADVNVIEFAVTTEEPGSATLTVDGVGRAILGKPNTVTVTVDGQRYVLLRENERLETPPSDARDGDRFEAGDATEIAASDLTNAIDDFAKTLK